MKTVYVIMAAAVACMGAVLALKSCGRGAVKQVQQIAAHKDDSAHYYRDLWGAEHAGKLLQQGDRKVIEAIYKGRMDSLCRRLGLRERQLQDMAAVLASDSGTFVAPARPDTMTIHDTLRQGLSFHWADDYMMVAGFVDSAAAYVNYNIQVPVNISTYWKRRWLLGRKRYYIDGYSDNPNVRLLGISGIKVN